jgi:hypothetical protein
METGSTRTASTTILLPLHQDFLSLATPSRFKADVTGSIPEAAGANSRLARARICKEKDRTLEVAANQEEGLRPATDILRNSYSERECLNHDLQILSCIGTVEPVFSCWSKRSSSIAFGPLLRRFSISIRER